MKIIITENSAEKLIDSLINEKLGVPDNIHKASFDLFKSIMSKIADIINRKIERDIYVFNIDSDIQFKELSLNGVILHMGFIQSKQVNNIDLMSMGIKPNVNPNKMVKGSMKIDKVNVIQMKLDLIYPPDMELTFEDVLDFFISRKDKMVEVISHELKHVYDGFMKGKQNVEDISQYEAFTELRSGVKAIDKFFFFLYYTTNIENLTRPTELAYKIKTQNITKKQFREFFNNDENVKLLKLIKNWSYQYFKAQLYANADKVYKFLNDIDPDYDGGTKEDVVNDVLDVIKQTAVVHFFQNYQKYYQFNIINKDTLKNLNTYKNKLQKKFKNPDDFFGFYEKILNLAGEKMLKKLAKLYDLAKSEENMNEDKSKIVNPNLYDEVHKDPSKFVKPSDIKKSKKPEKNIKKSYGK